MGQFRDRSVPSNFSVSLSHSFCTNRLNTMKWWFLLMGIALFQMAVFIDTTEAKSRDSDGDGTPDVEDNDDDNDGTPDSHDTDDDGDADSEDYDDDGDGIPDTEDEDHPDFDDENDE